MRISPLAFILNPDSFEARQSIHDVCRITHHNDEAYLGALAVLIAIRAAIEDNLTLESIASSLPDTSIRERLEQMADLASAVSLAEIGERFGTSGYVVESVPFALLAAVRSKEHGFVEMMNQVIAAGGDTDTNASMAGQIAGARLGFGRLPQDWIESLPQSELIFGIARDFAKLVTSETTHE